MYAASLSVAVCAAAIAGTMYPAAAVKTAVVTAAIGAASTAVTTTVVVDGEASGAITLEQLESTSAGDFDFDPAGLAALREQLAEVIDHAITSTMSRTIITHGSTQMMVLSMLVFGGETLHYFAVALTIGILFGIYSSVFVAAALAMWLGVKRDWSKPAKGAPLIGNDDCPLESRR